MYFFYLRKKIKGLEGDLRIEGPIKKLGYSNKTIIEHPNNMTCLRILEENMEKTESDDRAVC